MIEIIAGEKGKGKTKELLAKVNHSVAAASGNIVYLDKSPVSYTHLSRWQNWQVCRIPSLSVQNRSWKN